MRRAILLIAVVGVTVRADVTSDAPCNDDGGVEAASAQDRRRRPLLVVLHGNGETAEDRARPWREPLAAIGWELLALDCPRSRGCDDGAWYTWNGEPVWLFARVRDHAARVPVDPSRIYLAADRTAHTVTRSRVSLQPLHDVGPASVCCLSPA